MRSSYAVQASKSSGYYQVAAMISIQRLYYCVHVLSCLLLHSSSTLSDIPFSNSTAKLSTSWINQPSDMLNSTTETWTPVLMTVIDQGSSAFVCGFYCNYDGTRSKDCIFGILVSKIINYTISDHFYIIYPQLVWSANRNNPVQVNATLRLRQDGDLILENSDGTLVWSSHTGGKSVAGMNLTESGNLVLFGRNNQPIWQSFDHPTDSLLLGQKLMRGQRLTSSVSASNQSEGLFYLSLQTNDAPLPNQTFWNIGIAAYIQSDPPQRYYFGRVAYGVFYDPHVKFTNESFQYYNYSSAAQFMKFGPDGHLKVFRWGANDWAWTEDADLLHSRPCDYPMACGRYGVCSAGQCSCQGNFFKQNDYRQPNLGCSPVTQISCDHSKDHSLLELKNTYYFAFESDEEGTFVEDCKNRCLNNCSCKAAVFAQQHWGSWHSRKGSCLLLNEVFSIANNDKYQFETEYNTTLYIKVQHPDAKASRLGTVIIASALSTVFGVLLVIALLMVLFRKRNRQWKKIDQEDFLNDVPGIPTRYSYDSLKAATKDFSEKLGEGGFGSVYGGALSDGTRIAVKCLDGLGKVKDSFLVEVKAIGGIHHMNLVRLIGFCYENSHRILVYEYMAHRSLDGWIFLGKENQHCLPWNSRRKIISDIAKGLAYLHEECSQKIIHLDIKPQNILLDHNFNAKICDFGLSKLIEKDQSRVVTRMRGTPGYMAPEWLSSVVTEKVDVYSFGVVMLEIICGRKNVDWSKVEEEKHLLSLFKRKAEEEKLEELVDEKSEDMVNHIGEAVEMMGIGAWCLQGDFRRRPSMSIVVKVLEGSVAPETNLDYDFLNPTIVAKLATTAYDPTEFLPSELSGPR